MPKYRKKPVVIEAMQYVPPSGLNPDGTPIGGNIFKIIEWTDFAVTLSSRDWYPAKDENRGPSFMLKIRTLEDGNPLGERVVHMASPGDWIIKGVQGEFYACKPDIFEQTYEAVEE